MIAFIIISLLMAVYMGVFTIRAYRKKSYLKKIEPLHHKIVTLQKENQLLTNKIETITISETEQYLKMMEIQKRILDTLNNSFSSN